jgi:hypothetical protein
MNDIFKKYITIFYTTITTLFFVCLFTMACNDIYFGKTHYQIEKELMRSIFEVDSLIMDIKITLGDSSIIHKLGDSTLIYRGE